LRLSSNPAGGDEPGRRPDDNLARKTMFPPVLENEEVLFNRSVTGMVAEALGMVSAIWEWQDDLVYFSAGWTDFDAAVVPGSGSATGAAADAMAAGSPPADAGDADDAGQAYAAPEADGRVALAPDALRRLVHPDDLAGFDACLDGLRTARSRVRQIGFRLKRRDGGWLALASRFCAADPDVDGKPQRLLAMFWVSPGAPD
jgi:hypothetical protein